MNSEYGEILRHSSLFRGLPEGCIERMAGLVQRRRYTRGEVIFVRGDATDGIYGVIAGEIRIVTETEDGQERFLNIIRPGDVFGEISIIDGGPRTATAIAAEETHIFVIEQKPFLDALAHEPELNLRLLTMLCSLVRHTTEVLEDSAFLSVGERLAKFLLNLSRVYANEDLGISQSELALFLGASRQAVNQHLQDWQRDGVVSLSRNHIRILEPGKLAALIG